MCYKDRQWQRNRFPRAGVEVYSSAKIANLAPSSLGDLCQIGFACNSSPLINKSGLSPSLSRCQRAIGVGGALNANVASSHQHQNKAACAHWLTQDRTEGIVIAVWKPVLPSQSRALALSRQPINTTFTGMPPGCVRKTGKYAWEKNMGKFFLALRHFGQTTP